MKWFSKKNNLDEMQELKLLRIESRGFWLGFFGLAASMAAQAFVYGAELVGDMIFGELIVFLCMGLYLIGGCLKNGIWDRHIQPTFAANIILSLLAAAATALFHCILSYRTYQDGRMAIIVFIAYFFLIGTVLSVTLCLCTALYQKRRKQLEKDDEDAKD